ncbi:MAG: hypothetical protein KDE25_04300 [Novosphingobium sp.]|nr:hypothetical protein [Novosphingobium sp.]
MVLGDSFSEGTGSANDSEDFASIVARRLGIPDLWQSAFGGTGWVATNGSRPNLLDRIVPDGVDAEGDIYIVAMGISDNGNVFNNVVDSLTQLTQGRPLAKIFVVTGFNAQAPDAPIASKTNVNQQIRDAVALFPSVTLLDADGVSFAQSGSGNPDPAGHWTLGTWVSTQIERSLGIDGRVETYLSGDIVGPLFLKGFDPAETYTFTVLEDGNPSTRFEVVETGDAFPLLKLKSNEFIMVEPTSLQVRVVGSLGSDVTGDIAFGMIFPRFGDRNDNHIFGATTSVKIYGFEGVDYLIGSPEDDIIDAGPGNDKLDGGPGHDEMIGGPGNDIYWVDSIGDLVVEEVGEGYDIVMSSLDGYVLPANFEGLDLLGGALSGGGNDANNYLRGNGLNNKLFGRGGDDRIEGMSGRDLLDGGDDNDILDGGPDADTMIGGRGNDQYYVDDPLDAVRELSGEGGADWVFAAIDYTLPANVELLTIQGENGSGTGNNLANTIYGNATDNVLVGKGGKDTLYGYAGDDILNGGWGNDDLRGGGGTDTAVFAKVRASYTITPSGTLTYVRDNVTGELDTLRGIEILQFSDTSLPIA